MTNKEKTLWDNIKDGNQKLVKIIDSPTFRYQSINDGGYVDFDNRISTKSTYLTLSEVIEQNPFCELFIYPPSNEYPYWFETKTLVDPNTFEPVHKLVPYLKVCIIYLTDSQVRCANKLFEISQNNKKDIEYESTFIDNTNYRRNKLMLLLSN